MTCAACEIHRLGRVDTGFLAHFFAGFLHLSGFYRLGFRAGFFRFCLGAGDLRGRFFFDPAGFALGFLRLIVNGYRRGVHVIVNISDIYRRAVVNGCRRVLRGLSELAAGCFDRFCAFLRSVVYRITCEHFAAFRAKLRAVF